MKKLSVALVFMSFISTSYGTEITCTTKPFASCKTEDSCFDFFEAPGVDLEVVEGMCGSMEGEFSEAGCDRTGAVVSCLNATNPMMPMTHFFGNFTREEAAMACSALGGRACP